MRQHVVMRKVIVVVPWLLLVAGLALVVVAAVGGARQFFSALSPVAQWDTPGSHELHLEAGPWVVYQAAPRGAPTRQLLDPTDVVVTGPVGVVPTTCVYCTMSETLTLGSSHFIGVIRFTAPEGGTYTVTTETRDAELAVAPPALRTVGHVFVSLAWIGLGAALAAVGAGWLIVLLVVRLTRRASPPGTAT